MMGIQAQSLVVGLGGFRQPVSYFERNGVSIPYIWIIWRQGHGFFYHSQLVFGALSLAGAFGKPQVSAVFAGI